MGKRESEFQWIGDYLDSKKITLKDSGTWKLIDKISEKTCQQWHTYPFESVTVYVCEKVSSESDAGERAIMKIRTECVHCSAAPIYERALLNLSEYQQQLIPTLTLKNADRFQRM